MRITPNQLLIHQYPFRNYVREIVYSLDKTPYSATRKHLMIEHKDYMKDAFTYSPLRTKELGLVDKYAFGLLINPFNTNILPLDFDKRNPINILENIKTLPFVEDIDVLESSPGSYHMYLGLAYTCSVYKLLDVQNRSLLRFPCPGYCGYIRSSKQIVIRTSQKFSRNSQSSPIRHVVSITKEVHDKWRTCIYVKNPDWIKKKPKPHKRKVLRLR